MTIKKVILLTAFFVGMFAIRGNTQEKYTQTVSGVITDATTKQPLQFANVMVVNSDPPIGAMTDSTGRFILRNVPIGRVAIQASFIGYDPIVVSEISVTSGRQSEVSMEMSESSAELGEVVVQAKETKHRATNTMSTVSARKFNMEEASRYAGGFDDPARLATSFAGVTGSGTSSNAISIRGNSPRSLLWRIEGVEITNPSHFADLNAFGAGGISALSSRVIGNSDFYTGAFPAEYGNALGGIFDLSVRNGNTLKRSYTAEIGVNGLEAATEGPFVKGKQSTYLINYRYSTFALIAPLLPDGAGKITYQDLSFKVNMPTKFGTFSVWGLGSMDGSGQDAERDSAEVIYAYQREQGDATTAMGGAGISHHITVKEKTYIKTQFAGTGNVIRVTGDRLDSELALQPYIRIKNDSWKYTLSSTVNHRFGAIHTLRSGVILNYLNYDIALAQAFTEGAAPVSVVDEQGGSMHVQAFTQSQLRLHPRFRMNVGLHAQYFDYSKAYSIEPRLGMAYNISDNHTLNFGYGLHGQLEKLNFYMIQNEVEGGMVRPNRDLGLSKAHHLVLGYDWSINSTLRFKAEAYYQYLYDLPIKTSGSYALLNESDWFFRDSLVNNGTGQNYGLELTFERFLKKGLFYMFSGSVFNSEYTANGKTYSTRYNTNFVVNLLGGKEWPFGKHRQHRVQISGKFTLQGGERISPLDQSASLLAQEAVYDESRAFSERRPLVYQLHANFGLTFNGKRVTHGVNLKVLNASATKEFFGHEYNIQTQKMEEDAEVIIIPNLSYKIEF